MWQMLPLVDELAYHVLEGLKYSNIPCLKVRYETSRDNDELNIAATATLLDGVSYMAATRVQYNSFPTRNVH